MAMTRLELRQQLYEAWREHDKLRGFGNWVGAANRPVAIFLHPDDWADIKVEPLGPFDYREDVAVRPDGQWLFHGVPVYLEPARELGTVAFTWPDAAA